MRSTSRSKAKRRVPMFYLFPVGGVANMLRIADSIATARTNTMAEPSKNPVMIPVPFDVVGSAPHLA
jgi:hypothetical protein